MASASESTAGSPRGVSPQVAPPGWTIRGKRFVIPFVTVLCLLLAWTLGIAIQFQTIMTRLDRTRADWPAASEELATRFADFDAQLKSGSPEIGDADRSAWNTAYAAFQETSQYDRQFTHAAELEKIRSKADGNSIALPAIPSFAKFLASEQQRLEAERSMIGRWTITALRLKLPRTYTESM